MIIDDNDKVRENLLDIGYYRLGFYWFPFEETYPRKTSRTHNLKEGTNFDYAIKLYYFDFDLRNLFLRYISRIEVNFRTTVIYHVSNSYKENPYWYVDESIINKAVISSLEYEKALKDVNKEPLIIHDKKEHGKRDYAPAWKALEFMSFGTIIKLYENLINPHLKCDISKVYGMNSPSQFSNYINTVRRLRNCCAHEKVLFDLNLPAAIGDGPLGYLGCRKTMLAGAYFVFKYLLKQVSANRVTEMKADLLKAYERIETDKRFRPNSILYVRLDGRSFSKFTKGLTRPYDERLSRLMQETTAYLVDEYNARKTLHLSCIPSFI